MNKLHVELELPIIIKPHSLRSLTYLGLVYTMVKHVKQIRVMKQYDWLQNGVLYWLGFEVEKPIMVNDHYWCTRLEVQ